MDEKRKRPGKQAKAMCLRCEKTPYRRGLCTACYMRFHRIKAVKLKEHGKRVADQFDRDNIAAGKIAAPRSGVAKPEHHFVGV